MKSSSVKLSFVIAVYNSELYLKRCIDSIIDESNENIEIILVDDGSIDKSSQICDSYSKDNTFIRTIHKINEGVASARNIGIKEARGEYLFFVDNDDWINKNEIKNILKILSNSMPDLIINKYLIIKGNNKIIGNNSIKKNLIDNRSPKEVLDYLRNDRINITAPWEYIIKKEIITQNKISFDANESGVDDSCFTSKIFCCCQSFCFSEKIVYIWRIRLDSQGSNYSDEEFTQKMIHGIKNLEDYCNNINEKYKINFLLFRIYRDIYSLLGPYYAYNKKIRVIINKWYTNNVDLINKSVRYSGNLHKTLSATFGSFYGTIFSYKIAILKGKIYLYSKLCELYCQ